MRKQVDQPLIESVGRRIRQLRTECGLSLREFGKRADVHPFHVMAIELGQLAANTRTLGSIASVLGVTPADLLNHDVEQDVGAIIELMRTQPETIAAVRAFAELHVVN